MVVIVVPVTSRLRFGKFGSYTRAAAARRSMMRQARRSTIVRGLPVIPSSRMGMMRNRASLIGTGRPEIKVLDNNTFTQSSPFNQTAITPANNYTPLMLNLIATGTSFFNRVGRKVRLRNLFVELQAFPNGTANTEPTTHRFLVVYDRQPNGAVPSLNDVLQDVDQGGHSSGIANLITTHMNMNNRERFVIVMDERKILPAVAAANPFTPSAAVSDPDCYYVKRYVALPALETHFKADSSPAVATDIATGSLVFFALAPSSVEGWSYNGSIRLKYDDL